MLPEQNVYAGTEMVNDWLFWRKEGERLGYIGTERVNDQLYWNREVE